MKFPVFFFVNGNNTSAHTRQANKNSRRNKSQEDALQVFSHFGVVMALHDVSSLNKTFFSVSFFLIQIHKSQLKCRKPLRWHKKKVY